MPTYRNTTTGFKYNREKIIELVGWRTYYLIRHAKTRRKKYKKKFEEIDKEIEFLKPKMKKFTVKIGELEEINVECLIEGGVSVPGDFKLEVSGKGDMKIVQGKSVIDNLEIGSIQINKKKKDEEYDEWLKRLGC